MRVAPGASKYAGLAVLLAAAGYFLTPVLSVAGVALALFTLWFFRDPERTPPESGVVAPADGKVSVIREEASGSGGEESADQSGEVRLRVGVFMNVWNVHVNRAPMAGEVAEVDHRPGAHRPAFSKDSDRNERVWIDLGEDGAVVLIAGAFARRITTYVEVGDEIESGDRIGHIAFGSRADVVLPSEVGRDDLAVAEGDRVIAGETVIAATG